MAIAVNEPKYAIEPSDFRCAACSAEVAVEDPFFSAIFFESELFRRRSYCIPCWKKPSISTEEAYAFWRSRRPPPQAAPKKLRFDPDLILEFFRRLSASTVEPPGGPAEGPPREGPGGGAPPEPPAGGEPAASGAVQDPQAPGNEVREVVDPRGEKVRLRLVLALLLIRKKYLIFESAATRDGREWLKLSEKAEPSRIHLVENPPLSDEQLEAVKVSLGELLQMDLG